MMAFQLEAMTVHMMGCKMDINSVVTRDYEKDIMTEDHLARNSGVPMETLLLGALLVERKDGLREKKTDPYSALLMSILMAQQLVRNLVPWMGFAMVRY